MFHWLTFIGGKYGLIEKVLKRLNHFRVVLGLDSNTQKSFKRKRSTFKNCPLVWDTGASFGLTPFRNDFIDYVECSTPVNESMTLPEQILSLALVVLFTNSI